MKVNELIGKLVELDPDTEVFLADWNEMYASPYPLSKVILDTCTLYYTSTHKPVKVSGVVLDA